MKKYVVEFTSAENSFVADFNDDWYREIVEADSIVEAVDCVKDTLDEEGIGTEGFLFRVDDEEIAELTGVREWVYIN